MHGVHLKQEKGKWGFKQFGEWVINPRFEAAGVFEDGIAPVKMGVKLDMLVKIIDCLDCTADDLFYGSIKNSYKAKSSKISDKIDQLSPKDQAHILEVLELMVNNISK